MLEENISALIGSVGFPIVMCLWFMFRTEKVIKANTNALNLLRVLLSRR